MTTFQRRLAPTMIDAPSLMTAAELVAYDTGGQRTELDRGRLIVHEPAGGPHASVLHELSLAIGSYLRTTAPSAGRVFVGDPGFWITRDPDTVRAPDLAFVARDRLPGGVPSGFLAIAPDLAVEIRSPSDRTGALLQKVGQWLDAGVTSVWVIDPPRRRAQHFAADGTITLCGEHDALTAPAVLPDLRVPLSALLANLAGA